MMEELLSIINSDDLLNEYDDVTDKNIIFYAAGYITRSVIRELRCTDCRDICVTQNDEPKQNFYPLNTIDQQSPSRASRLEQVNRGGLCTPCQTVYISTLCYWNFYQTLIAKCSVIKEIYASHNSREAYVRMVTQLISEGERSTNKYYCEAV